MDTLRVVFLIPERSGSTHLGRILSGNPMFHNGMSFTHPPGGNHPERGPNNLIYVATQPPYTVPLYTLGTAWPRSTTAVLDEVLTAGVDSFPIEVWLDNLLDFPTGLVDPEISPHNAWNSGTSWTKEHIQHYSNRGNFKFVNLMRDGRNQVASYKQRTISARHKAGCLNWTGKDMSIENWEIDAELKSCFRQEVQMRSRRFQFRARNTLEAQASCDNYMVLKFEDLVTDEVGTLQKLMEFTGLSLDLEGKIANVLQKAPPNSSYRAPLDKQQQGSFDQTFQKSDTLKRWTTLSREERECFHSIAAQEMVELGYLKNLNDTQWIDED